MGVTLTSEARDALRLAAAVSDLTIDEVLDDPAYQPLLLAAAREALGQAPGFLASRIGELTAAIEAGDRARGRENLDLLAAYERLDRLGRPLNAVAAVAGAPRRSAGGALSGRPVAVKDIIAIDGLPTRCGSPSTSDTPATADATLVSRLRAAGAEVFAAAQCLEFAAGFAHPGVGDTRNPRNPERTSGGSSGGSAALVAASVCDLAIGTDTGGSIRIPAAYCGIVGLKPTYGLVPADGVFPLSPSLDHAGTLTATAAGAMTLLQVIAGPLPAPRALGVPVIGVLSAQLADPSVTPEVHAALRAALRRLAAAGWQLREVTPPWVAKPRRWEEAMTAIVASEAVTSHAGRDTSQYAEGTRALLALGAGITPEQYATARAAQADLAAAVEETLAGVDALAGPTVGYCAPEQDPPFGVDGDNAEGRFTGPYNLTGHPAVSIPVPALGLPVGLQLAGRHHGDLALLELAAAAQSVLATSLLERAPAVDRDDLAGHPARPRRGEEAHAVGDVGGLTEPAGGDPGDQRPLPVRAVAVPLGLRGRVGQHEAGRDAVHGNPVRAELVRHLPGEAELAGLGGGVGLDARLADGQPGGR